jgi:hypothetical protein
MREFDAASSTLNNLESFSQLTPIATTSVNQNRSAREKRVMVRRL